MKSELVGELILLLRQTHSRLATVESCTGGLIAHWMTEIPGASDVFWGGFVTYSDDAKILLGVSKSELEKYGAVSPEIAKAMAEAGLKKVGTSTYVLSTTGIAGPAGATPETPLGSCYIALAGQGKPCLVEKIQIQVNLENRSANKIHFADEALSLLVGVLKD